MFVNITGLKFLNNDMGDRKSGRKGSREPVLVIDPAAAGLSLNSAPILSS